MSQRQPSEKRGGGGRHAPAKSARTRVRKAKRTTGQPSRQIAATNGDSKPAAQSVPAEKLAASAGALARVPLGIVFRISQEEIHSFGGSKAAALEAVRQRVLLAAPPFKRARSDLAAIFQATPDALPIVWAQLSPDEVAVALLPPEDVELTSLTELQLASIEVFAKNWRQAIARLAARSDRPGTKGQERRDPDDGSAKGKSDQRLEASAARLEQALKRGTQTHALELGLICNGMRDESPARVIGVQPTSAPASLRLGKSEEIIAHIERITGDGTCELRVRGARRKQSAEFSASGLLQAQLALACGCPELHLKVRRCLSDESTQRPSVDFLIEEIAALSPAWIEGSPSVLDHLQACIDSLRSLPQRGGVVQQSLP